MQSILHLSRGNLMVSHCTSITCCLVPGLQDPENIDLTFSQKCTFLVPFFLIVLPLLTVTFTPGCVGWLWLLLLECCQWLCLLCSVRLTELAGRPGS